MFVAPAIKKWLGYPSVSSDTPALDSFIGTLGESLSNRGDRPHYLRVKVDRESGNRINLFGTQQSHAVYGLARADALVRLLPGESFEEGDSIQGWWI